VSKTWARARGRRKRAVVAALLAILAPAVLPLQMARAGATTTSSASVPLDPWHQLHVPVQMSELPVPPTVPSNGVCTNTTGCVAASWGGFGAPGFYWDPHYVLLGMTYAGAPSGSIYSGPQVLIVKTDGTIFPNGDAWKCITCGATLLPGVNITQFPYPPPHEFPDGKRVLVGNGILSCGQGDVTYAVTDPRCTPQNTTVYPIYWGSQPLFAQTPTGNNGREWRLSPDGVHLAWDSLNFATFTELPYVGRLSFDQANQRYDLTNISILFNPAPQFQPYVVEPGNKLKFNPAGMIGELRGWTNDGKAILGIQSYESSSVDLWATDLATGRSTPLTDHAEYTDPNFMSPNGEWLLSEEVAGSGRLDFISGMEGVPPITDQLPTTGYISQIRNNGQRRFFLPWLVNPARAQSEQINAGGDPNWNAAADPVWLANSTSVVWTENLACGANIQPTPCTSSTEPGGRNSRVMIARFPTLRPSRAIPPPPVSDTTWGIPYVPGQTPPAPPPLPPGTYTLEGRIWGSATVVITDNASNTAIMSIAVAYHNFIDQFLDVINGTESVQRTGTSPFTEQVTWFENLRLSGLHTGTKVTSPGGFTLGPSVLLANNFQAVGTMTTTIDGVSYTQPANGT
jgi:hypothetical protein